MRHLEEGTIHAWLDGELSKEEAAAAEAHVAECAECRKRVAEARGFVAGATRILSSLDNVPAEVIPRARPRRRFDPVFMRAAAAVLVVATTGLLISRVAPNDVPPRDATMRDTAAQATTAAKAVQQQVVAETSKAPRLEAGTPAKVAVGSVPPTRPVGGDAVARRVAKTSRDLADRTAQREATDVLPPPPPPTPAMAPVLPEAAGNKNVKPVDTTTLDIVLTRDVNQLQANVVTGVATTGYAPLKVVKEQRVGSDRITTYEIEPGKRVDLVETNPVTTTSARDNAAPTRASVVQPRAPVTVSDTIARPNSINTLRWTDSSGKIMSLTGPFTFTELRQLRRRIEQQRASEKN